MKQLKDTEKRLDEIIEAIEIGGYSRHLNARLHKLEEMRTTLEDRIDQTPGEEVVIPPPNRFREKVENLAASLRRVEERDEAIEALRMLVQKIVITAKSGWRTPIQLTVHGNLATLLGTKDHIGPDIAVIAPA